MKDNQLLRLNEAAKLLGVSAITLRNWDNQGILKAVRIGTRKDRRFRKADVLALQEQFASVDSVTWQEYVRHGVTYHNTYQVVYGLTAGLKEHFGRGINYLLAYIKESTLYWYYNDKDLYELGSVISNKILGSKKFEDFLFDYWDKRHASALEFFKQYDILKIAKLTNSQLAKLYLQYSKLIEEFYSASIIIDALDESLMVDVTKRLKEILKAKLGKDYSEKAFAEVYNILTSPNKLSYVSDEKLEILKLARDIDEGNVELGTKQFEDRAHKIIQQFWWTGLGWSRGEPKNIKDVIGYINDLGASQTDYQAEIEKITGYASRILSQKHELDIRAEVNADKELSSWLYLVEKLVEYHDRRKEVQVKAVFWDFPVLDEIARRTGIPSKLIEWCDGEEIIQILETGEIDEQELNQRSLSFLYAIVDAKHKIFSGKLADREYAKILHSDDEEVRDIQGSCASQGTVTGEAHVALSPNKAHDIKPGQILVTGMTTPDYVPAMKKAAAIITDEGGITCHAAIISREFGIPCIVGTKYATKYIKSGDVIEVRANHGVIRILGH
jgi:excisionase family DNA binding protein